MSIFGKPLSQLTKADLEELLTAKAVENIRLEFKRTVPGKDETVKKLSSFANTYGGYMVVGAQASSSDGRIEALPGVDLQAGYKQTIVQWCADAVNPFVDVDVSDPIKVTDDKVCYVLSVRESELAPHFLNNRLGAYVRTNEFSTLYEPRLANESEIRHLLDRRALVLQRRAELISRARDRFEAFGDIQPEELENEATLGPRMDLAIIPRFPSANVSDQASLLRALQSVAPAWRGNKFPHTGVDYVSQHESAICLFPASRFSFLEANTWGLLFYATEIEREVREHRGIHLDQFCGYLLVFLRHATAFLARTGYSGPLHLEMKLQSIRGVPWIRFERDDPKKGVSSPLDAEVTFSLSTTTNDLASRPDGVAVDLLRVVFFALNWPDLAAKTELLQAVVKDGYSYNGWRGEDPKF